MGAESADPQRSQLLFAQRRFPGANCRTREMWSEATLFRVLGCVGALSLNHENGRGGWRKSSTYKLPGLKDMLCNVIRLVHYVKGVDVRPCDG